MSNLKSCTEQSRYILLFKVTELVLLLRHSNVGGERFFSMVHKNKASFGASLGKGTLSFIFTLKLSGKGL